MTLREAILTRISDITGKPIHKTDSKLTKVVIDPKTKKPVEVYHGKATGKNSTTDTSLVKDPETKELKLVWKKPHVKGDKHRTQFAFKSPATVAKATIKGSVTRKLKKSLGLYLKDVNSKTGVKDYNNTQKYLKNQLKAIQQKNKKNAK